MKGWKTMKIKACEKKNNLLHWFSILLKIVSKQQLQILVKILTFIVSPVSPKHTVKVEIFALILPCAKINVSEK